MSDSNALLLQLPMEFFSLQWNQLVAWIEQHEVMLWWLGALSAVVTIGTLIAMPWVVAFIPDDYFATRERPPYQGRSRSPAMRWLLHIGKNCLGLLLVILGLVLSMPLIPGQGMVMAVAGLLLLDFPGKRRFEMWIIRQHGILRVINWFRAKKSRPPLVVWSPEELVTTEPEPSSPPLRQKVVQGREHNSN